MNQEQLNKFETLIIEAVEKHLASGGELVTGQFTSGVDNTCKCPISCIIDPNNEKSYSEQLSDKIGFEITDHDMWAFIYGFDYTGNNPDPKSRLFCFGHEMRQKYLPIGVTNE